MPNTSFITHTQAVPEPPRAATLFAIFPDESTAGRIESIPLDRVIYIQPQTERSAILTYRTKGNDVLLQLATRLYFEPVFEGEP